ncbi:MAG: shikimate kinase [Microbacteriaceae bacterium]
MKPAAVLIGPPAAGKSRLGKRIARILDVPFIDTDVRIAAEHGPIPEIFAQHGEAKFREWERHEVSRALAQSGVVSLGGGAIENSDTRRELANHIVVLVTVSEEAVAGRLDNDNRPLLDGIDSWKTLFARRQPIYTELATITIDTSVGPMDQHAERLAEMVRAAQ